MKIVADEEIPQLQHYFGGSNELVLKSGRSIAREDLIDADILIVRSITPVSESLLKNTSIKFVASVTTGYDHLDINYLDKNNIRWAIAAGCNATAVVEYVISVVATLQKQGLLPNKNINAAVIGVGHIGNQVVEKLKILGFEVVQCDPLRAMQDKSFASVPLENLQDLDFITLHTPLTNESNYPTYHMIEQNFLQRQKPGCVLLNTGRGAVINFSDLKQYGKHLHWCLDVWENEPRIDQEILQSSMISTPHIAGYSVQSKYRGVEMIYQAAVKKHIFPDNKITPLPYPVKEINFEKPITTWRDVILEIYDPMRTSQIMKDALLNNKTSFDFLRKNFIERFEFGYVKLLCNYLANENQIILSQLGV